MATSRLSPLRSLHHGSALGRITRRIGLAALLVTALFTLSQCRQVGDRLNGIDLSPLKNSVAKCIDKCQKAADQEMRMEDRFHASRVSACGGNAGCLAAEEARHTAAVQDIENRRQACIDNCHAQGGGGDS